ncbi:MAG: heme ABC exporter ATP-binding protein CcmA [Rickettsiales bacterium]
MLSCVDLSLVLNGNILFKNLSFTAVTGSLIIIRGLNGSGKTCFFKTICNFLSPAKGDIVWNGVNVLNDINAFRSNVAYIPEKSCFSDDLTVFENLDFWTKYRGELELFLPAIRYFSIEDLLDKKFGDLSAGQKKRVELSKLMLFRAGIWLLDEPDNSLDKTFRNRLIDLIKVRSKEGGVILMTTHNEKDLGFANYIDIGDFCK